MAIGLGANRYGKAETRIIRVARDDARHELTDLNVSIALAGGLADSHLTGDNSHVLPTDSQKNTVYAFAREHGIGQIEDFGLLLARHLVDAQPAVCFAYETQMDKLAAALGLDPVEVRVRNALHTGGTMPTGQVVDSP